MLTIMWQVRGLTVAEDWKGGEMEMTNFSPNFIVVVVVVVVVKWMVTGIPVLRNAPECIRWVRILVGWHNICQQPDWTSTYIMGSNKSKPNTYMTYLAYMTYKWRPFPRLTKTKKKSRTKQQVLHVLQNKYALKPWTQSESKLTHSPTGLAHMHEASPNTTFSPNRQQTWHAFKSISPSVCGASAMDRRTSLQSTLLFRSLRMQCSTTGHSGPSQ